uniref:Putative secreted protein n=1 Tax=Anopheles marajoara TaxID=58244 RepID=A0A2M4CAX2_9DIPT
MVLIVVAAAVAVVVSLAPREIQSINSTNSSSSIINNNSQHKRHRLAPHNTNQGHIHHKPEPPRSGESCGRRKDDSWRMIATIEAAAVAAS